MESARVVLQTVLSVLLIMGVGALARRRGLVSDAAIPSMSRLVADVTFPALCFDGLARADADTLRGGGVIAALGFVTLAVAAVVGFVLVRAANVRSRSTAVFAIAIGNWIFLPLPLADALYGSTGTTTVVLNNVGAQVFLWTVGIVILRGRFDLDAAKSIARSPGLWATAAGIVVALTAPGTAIPIVGDAIAWVGSMTVPLVSIAIGAQLAGPSASTSMRDAGLVVLARLVLAPAIVIAWVEVVVRSGVVALPVEVRVTEHLIATMPVSLSAAALVERYGGDTALVSRVILITTLASVVTAPLWMLLLRWVV